MTKMQDPCISRPPNIKTVTAPIFRAHIYCVVWPGGW